MAETPQGSEPKKETPTLPGSEPKPQATEDQVKELLGTLDKLGVKKSEQLVNMATASSQSGRVQNLLGDANRRIQELEAALSGRSAKPQAPIEDTNGQTIDLAALIEERSGRAAERAVRKVVQEMNEAQSRQWNEAMSIQADDDYGLVKEVWDKFVVTPEAQGRLRAGETTMKDLYGEVKVKYMKEMLRKSHDVIEGLASGVKPGQQKLPHIEGGETRGTPTPEPDDEKKEKIQTIAEQRRSGKMNSDAALESIIKTLLPADDPIWSARR